MFIRGVFLNKLVQVLASIYSGVLKPLKLFKHQLLYDVFLTQHQWVLEHLIDSEKRNRHLFEKHLNRSLDLDKPLLFNDKIQWLKLNWYSHIASKVVDKFEVRTYVTGLIGENYLNGIIGVFDSVNDIDFELLPTMFALKASHGSGFNIICTDKSSLDWNRAKKKIKLWLKTKYYLMGNEFVYKGIKPRIILEEFISDDYEKGINDYKFFTFHGKVKFLYISYKNYDSFGNMSKKRRYFSPEWKEITINNSGDVIFVDTDNPKPHFLDKMLLISETLAKPFPHVRVDLYYEKDNIFFGELTFFHSNGMEQFPSLAFERFMGEFIDINKIKREIHF